MEIHLSKSLKLVQIFIALPILLYTKQRIK